MTLVDLHARRVSLHQHIALVQGQLNLVRWANGTQPRTLDEWMGLIRDRVDDLDADGLVGLAADVLACLEMVCEADAA